MMAKGLVGFYLYVREGFYDIREPEDMQNLLALSKKKSFPLVYMQYDVFWILASETILLLLLVYMKLCAS